MPRQNNAAANSDEECPHCLLSPCITEGGNDGEFVGGGSQGPCVENQGIRHRLYRRHWTHLDFLGVWQKPIYLARKVQSAGREWVLVVKREIMPVCVLKKVRTLYPNPSGVPCVGQNGNSFLLYFYLPLSAGWSFTISFCLCLSLIVILTCSPT